MYNMGSGTLGKVLLPKVYQGNASLTFCMGYMLNRCIQIIGQLLLVLVTLSQPVKADLNASYSPGDVLFAAYEIPRGVNAENIRLATAFEYSTLGGDLPEFYDNITVADRSAAVGELFISTNAIVYDQAFDLLFVDDSDSGVIDWFRLSSVNGAVKITKRQTSSDQDVIQKPASPNIEKTYNQGNREVVALLLEVSRQLAKKEEQALAVKENPIMVPSQVGAVDTKTVAENVQAIPVVSQTIVPETISPTEPLTLKKEQIEVLSEVRIAVASLKNFVLTIIVSSLALTLAVYLILSKTKGYMAKHVAASSRLPDAPQMPGDNAMASATFLHYIKEENKRTQETFLRSLEVISEGHKHKESIDQSVLMQSDAGIETTDNTPAGLQKSRTSDETDQKFSSSRQESSENKINRAVTPTEQKKRGSISGSQTPTGQQELSPLPIRQASAITAKVKEQLDLAEVYKNMGDIFSAQNLLQEVIQNGNAAEVSKATQALEKLGNKS